jgi:chloramphenicol 3-O-phosphotransferase
MILLQPKFPLGLVVTTPGAQAAVPVEDMAILLQRHAIGDWGNMPNEDILANTHALVDGNRLMSAYEVNGVRVWVITEADRSVTTLLLPEEY